MPFGQRPEKKKAQMILFEAGRLFALLGLAGCFLLPTPPSSRVDVTAPIYPEPKNEECSIAILTSPPPAPHEAFAQITIRGNEDQMEEMQEKMRKEACVIGADAVVAFRDDSDVRVWRDTYPEWVENRAPHTMATDYDFSLIGIAILYKKGKPKAGMPRPTDALWGGRNFLSWPSFHSYPWHLSPAPQSSRDLIRSIPALAQSQPSTTTTFPRLSLLCNKTKKLFLPTSRKPKRETSLKRSRAS